MRKILENSFVRKFGYDLANKTISLIIQSVVVLILATLIAPEAFGIVGLSMVFITFFNIFSSFGLENSFVYYNEEQNDFFSLFLFTVFLGLFLGFVSFISSKGISLFYKKTELELVIQILSLNFPFISVSILFKAFLTKRLFMKELAFVEVLSVVIGGLVGVTLAIFDFSYMSLVLMHLTQTFCKSVGYWSAAKLKGFSFYSYTISYRKIKKYINYSLNIVFFGVINFISQRVDILILGRILNSEQLGYYSLAYDLLYRPTAQITMAYNRILFPTLNKVRNSFQQVTNYYRSSLKAFFTTFSLLFLLFVTALSLVVYVSFFEKWGPIIPLLFIFSLISITRFIISSGGSIILISGKPHIQWKIALFINIPLSFAGIYLGYHYFPFTDIINVALGYVFSSTLGALPSYKWALSAFKIDYIHIFRGLIFDILIVLFIFSLYSFVLYQFTYQGFNSWLLLGLIIGILITAIKLVYSYKDILKFVSK
ncbi:oligosaccharide flippase family protein [Salinivirga cyanobacteriivorans]